jgi:AbrB family looped-hinge helix DNA binding protein
MRSSYKRSDFGEMKRGEYVARAQVAALANRATATLSVDGRVTIPNSIRDALNLQAGVTLKYTLLSNDTVAIRAQQSPKSK